MPNQLAQDFRTELDELQSRLLSLSPALADSPLRPGGWTRKQVLGHLLDSAANNRQRFVRAATNGEYIGPKYVQEAWVAAHGYARQPWEALLRWWQVEHEILAAVIDNTPENRLEASCIVGTDASVTLRFLVEDYLRHQRQHIEQLLSEDGTS